MSSLAALSARPEARAERADAPLPRTLFLDAGIVREWRPLAARSEVTVAEVPGTLEPGGRVGLDEAMAVAREHAGRHDRVIVECTGGFLWHCAFRLAGDRTPFVLVPRFNHVHAPAAYALLLSSQMRIPGDLLYAGSRAASVAFGRFGFEAEALYLPGVDLDHFVPPQRPRRSLRAALGVAGHGPLLLFAGRMAEDKNVLELLEIFRRVRSVRPDAELVVCHQFPSAAYLARCTRRAHEIGGVRLVADPAPGDLVRWYQVADLFVTAAVSVFETFGRGPVEAMACGTPSVVPDYDGFRDTVAPDCGFRVPTLDGGLRRRPDVTALAEAVLSALSDSAALAGRATAGLERCRSFDWRCSLAALEARLGAGPGKAGLPPPDVERRLELAAYPPEVATLWGPLEGKSVRRLVSDFLTTGEVPIRPRETVVREFYRSWFRGY